MGVVTISRGCFERCCSKKKTPPYHSNLSFVTLRDRRPTLLRASAYRTPSEASPRRRCGHASRFLRTDAHHRRTRHTNALPPPVRALSRWWLTVGRYRAYSRPHAADELSSLLSTLLRQVLFVFLYTRMPPPPPICCCGGPSQETKPSMACCTMVGASTSTSTLLFMLCVGCLGRDLAADRPATSCCEHSCTVHSRAPHTARGCMRGPRPTSRVVL